MIYLRDSTVPELQKYPEGERDQVLRDIRRELRWKHTALMLPILFSGMYVVDYVVERFIGSNDIIAQFLVGLVVFLPIMVFTYLPISVYFVRLQLRKRGREECA